MSRALSRSSLAAVVVALGLSLALSESAWASFTTIQPTTFPQKNQQQILDQIYGAGFASVGVDFYNATLNIWAKRVEDTPQASNLVPTSGNTVGVTDQVWGPGAVSVSAKARFATYGQHFGYVLNNDPASLSNLSNYNELFNTTGNLFAVAGSGALNKPTDNWRWARWSGTTTSPDGLFQTSLQSDNIDNPAANNDHLVTYQIVGLADGASKRTWALFWEDLNIGDPKSGPKSDRDFNDLVVEVKATYVPLPSSALSGLGMLMGMGAIGAARRFWASV